MMDELRLAMERIDREIYHAVIVGHKRCARKILRNEPYAASPRSLRIVDRWFRRLALHHPMGRFFHGSSFNQPRRVL